MAVKKAKKTRNFELNDLPVDSRVLIQGFVNFSRIASQIAGEELERDKEKRIKMNARPINRPYTQLTLEQVKILPQDKNATKLKDEKYLTDTERYALERRYTTNSDPNIKKYQGINKGNSLPRVFVLNEKTGKYEKVILKRELAKGLNVTMALKVFETTQGNGIALEDVFIHEPLRYYDANSASNDFYASQGFVIDETVDIEEIADDNEDESIETTSADNPYGHAQNDDDEIEDEEYTIGEDDDEVPF